MAEEETHQALETLSSHLEQIVTQLGISAQIKSSKATADFKSLPHELQNIIWHESYPNSGVNHFVLKFPETIEDRVLVIERKAAKVKDGSIWKHRRNLISTCRTSRHVSKFRETVAKANGDIPCVFPIGPKKIRKPREKVTTYGKTDLLCFTFKGTDFDITRLDLSENRRIFKGVQEIGLRYKKQRGHNYWAMPPFKCLCPDDPHKEFDHCPVAVAEFLVLFPDLKCLYLVYGCNGKDFDKPQTKKSALQIIAEALAHFQDDAVTNQLEVLQDNDKTYYQVVRSGDLRLEEFEKIQLMIRGVCSHLRVINHGELSQEEINKLRNVRVKLLLC